MSLIVAARFTTFPAAEEAAQKLFNAGFVEEDVTLFFVNPRGQHARFPIGGDTSTDAGSQGAPKGAGLGVTIGAVVGAIVGVGIFAAFSAPLLVSVIAAGVGAYIGSLAGAMWRTRESPEAGHRTPFHEETRDSGVLVAVHVSPDNQLDAARVLREAGGVSIERATGRWQQGRWADFDPLKQPVPLNEYSEKRA
ncbi:MAG: putative membrane protein [uncultured Paraburkholderia sp.]|nr:MAG: putative membrane protein [uncultured Paraburkholderia sp.]CAH2932807.1 MAG: putative membrane protein [uncultured Paraburkholderia sp.]CAH2934331.1 MAG: putative membrane protein [uncultured Paraburkholderia sp.]